MNKLKFIALVSLLLGASSSVAFAQEADPFAAYEGNAAAPAPPPAPEPPPAPAPPPAPVVVVQPIATVQAPAAPQAPPPEESVKPATSALVVEEVVPIQQLFERNHFSVHTTTSLAYDGNFDEVLGGKRASSSALNALIALGIGYTVWDNVTLELSGGSLWRRNAQNEYQFGTEHDWLFLVRGWYSLPVGARTALLGGVGLGGYFGTSEIKDPTNQLTAGLSTKTAGFLGKLNGGLAYVFGESWQFRMLLDFTWLVGKEDVTNQTGSLADNAVHLGFELGVTYTF